MELLDVALRRPAASRCVPGLPLHTTKPSRRSPMAYFNRTTSLLSVLKEACKVKTMEMQNLGNISNFQPYSLQAHARLSLLHRHSSSPNDYHSIERRL